jgi:hypothetical protein
MVIENKTDVLDLLQNGKDDTRGMCFGPKTLAGSLSS